MQHQRFDYGNKAWVSLSSSIACLVEVAASDWQTLTVASPVRPPAMLSYADSVVAAKGSS